jgi:hypothetical protein
VAVAGLRLAELGAVADGEQRLADREDTGVEVDRGPGQADRLAAAQPGGGQQQVEGGEPVAGGVLQEPAQLVRRPDRQLRPRAAAAAGPGR